MGDVVFEIPFSGGIDESTQEELADAQSSFTTLENVRQNHRGGATKREGYSLLSSDGTEAVALRRFDSANATSTAISFTTRNAGRRLLTNSRQPCVIDGTHLDSFSSAADSWVNKGRVPEATYRFLEAPSVGFEDPADDIVECGGVTVVAYTLRNTVSLAAYAIVAVIDTETGAVTRAPESTEFASGTTNLRTRLATYGAYIVQFVADYDDDEIHAWYLDTTSRTTLAAGWQSIGTIAADFGSDCIDVASMDTRVAVAYQNTNGGTSRLTVKTLTVSGVVETVNISTSSITPTGMSLAEGGDTLWVAWAEETVAGPTNTTDFKVIGLDPTNIDGTPLATAATVIQTVRSGLGGGMTWLAVTGSGTGVLYAINENVFACDGISVRAFTTTAGATTTVGSTNKIGNSVPVGRPFLRGTQIYMPLASSTLEEIVLCDVTPPSVVFTWRPVVVPVPRGIYNLLTSFPRARTVAIDGDRYRFVFNVLRSGSQLTGGVSGTVLVEYDFASSYRWKPVELGGSTFLSGGVECVFDGRRVFEAGFLCRPPPPTVDTSGTGAMTFTNGGRSYVATYEEVDTDGNWHISGVSGPTSTGDVTSALVSVGVAPLSITARTEDSLMPFGAGVRIGLWATTDGNEEPYHRVATISNDPFQTLITYSDTTSEDNLSAAQLLYGTGNLPGTGASQDHRAPPGLEYHVSYNGMIVGAAGKSIYFSGQPIDGEGTWFSPLFTLRMEEDVTGLTVQDGSLVIFSLSGAWIASGDPPSDNGATGGLSTPRKLAVDQGCINANSIVTTSVGTFYQSARGLELLTRGQTVTYIGGSVQDTLASYPIVSSAVLDTKDGLVRFSLAESQTGGVVSANGRDLVFDLAAGAWVSRDTKYGSAANQASQDACMAYVEDAWRYCWLDSDGIVYYQKTANYLDGSAWVTTKAVTPWVHIAGFQGEQFVEKVLFLARQHTDCDVTVSLAFDYSDTFTSTQTFTAAQIGALARPWLDKEIGDLTTHTAVRVKVEDATPSSGTVGTGKGATWSALSFIGTPHRGGRRTTGAQRGGSN